jgi:hypothetical protein
VPVKFQEWAARTDCNLARHLSRLRPIPLQFYFNYITSDGAQYADYAFAQLQTASGTPVATLFTARTTVSGNTSPGYGLPSNGVTLTPSATPIMPRARHGRNSVRIPENTSTLDVAVLGFRSAPLARRASYLWREGVTRVGEDACERNAGLGFAAMAIDLQPAISAVEALSDRRGWLRRSAIPSICSDHSRHSAASASFAGAHAQHGSSRSRPAVSLGRPWCYWALPNRATPLEFEVRNELETL